MYRLLDYMYRKRAVGTKMNRYPTCGEGVTRLDYKYIRSGIRRLRGPLFPIFDLVREDDKRLWSIVFLTCWSYIIIKQDGGVSCMSF